MTFQGNPPDRFTPGDARRMLVLLNPKAGGGFSGQGTRQAIEQAMDRLVTAHPDLAGWQERVEFFTGTPDELRTKLTEDPQRYDRVLAAGGDGTVTCVIRAVQDFKHVNVGILPLGTGNRIAKTLGIPNDIGEALRIALTGKPRPLDVMRVNGQISTLAVDAGIGAAMMHRANKRPWLKRLLGVLAYPLVALDLMVVSPVIPFRLTIDGGKEKTIEAAGVAVVNGGDVGGITITPGASNNDGVFDVAILAAGNRRLKTARQILDQTPGSIHERKGLLNFQAKRLTIDTADGSKVPIEIDGDPAGTTPMEIEMVGQVPILISADA